MGTKFHVHHSCGHTALVDSPGPLDPGGLVAKDAPKGMQALNLAARPCFECARVAGPIEPLGPATSMCLYRRGDVTRTEVCTLPLGHPGDHLLVTLPMAPANEPLPSAEDLDAAAGRLRDGAATAGLSASANATAERDELLGEDVAVTQAEG